MTRNRVTLLILLMLLGLGAVTTVILWALPGLGSSAPVAAAEGGPAEAGGAPTTDRAALPVRDHTEAERREQGRADSAPDGTPDSALTEGSLRVRVFWSDTLEPVTDSRVRLISQRHELNWWAPTDENGVAPFEGVSAGPIDLVSALGVWIEAEAVAGVCTEVDLALTVGLTIEGEVVDTRGAPIAGAGLWLGLQGASDNGQEVGVSGRDGRFRLRCAETEVCLGVHARGYLPSLRHCIEGEAGEVSQIRFTLEGPGGSLDGIVVDTEDRPVPDAWVLLGSGNPRGAELPGEGFAAYPTAFFRDTDDDGRFTAESLPLGELPISVRVQGFALWKGSVDVTPHAVARPRIVLEREAVLYGTVRDGEGDPVAGAVIKRTDPSFQSNNFLQRLLVVSGEDGSFELGQLPAGRLRFNAFLDDSVFLTRTLEAGERSRWDPVFGGSPRILGQLLDRSGAPVAGWRMYAGCNYSQGGVGIGDVATTDAQGRFVLKGLADVPFTLEASAPERAVAVSRWRDVRPGPEEQQFHVEADGLSEARIVGTILDAARNPVGEGSVSLRRETPRYVGSHSVDPATGRFDIGPLPAGTFTLQLEQSGFPSFPLGVIELVHDEQWDLGTVTLPETGQLVVTLDGGDGIDSAEASLQILSQDRETVLYFDIENGSATALVFAGSYRLQLYGEFLDRELPVSVEPGVVTELTVEVEAAICQEIVCEMDASLPFPRHLDLEVVRADGVLVVTESRPLSPDTWRRELSTAPQVHTVAYSILPLLPGSYVIRAVTDTGHRESASTDLAFGQEAEQIVLLLR